MHDSILVATSNQHLLGQVDDDRAWIYAIARNECARAQASRRHMPPADPAPTPDGDDPLATTVWRSLGHLDQASRDLLLLTGRHRLTHTHVATILGVSPRRVRHATDQVHRRLVVAGASALQSQSRSGAAGALRERVEAALASGDLCPPPEGLHEFVHASCAVPARVLHYGVRAGQFQANGFPRPWDRLRARPVTTRSALAGCVILLALLVAAADGAATHAAHPATGRTPATRHEAGSVPRAEGPLRSPAMSPSVAPSTASSPNDLGAGRGGERAVVPSPAHPTPPRPSPHPPGAARPAARFDSAFNIGCGSPWSGTATAILRGTAAREAVFRWQNGSAVHTTTLRRAADGGYRAQVRDLPAHTTIRWWVEFTGDSGWTLRTAARTARPNCLL